MPTSRIFRKQNIGYFFAAVVTGALILFACTGDIEHKTKHPFLSLLPQANSIYIQVDCKDPKTAEIAHYFLQRGENDFSGQVHYTINPGQQNSCSNISVESVVIPRKTAQNFLEMLSRSILDEGSGPGIPDTGNCPSIKIEVGLETGRVVFFTASQGVNQALWNVIVDGNTYTVGSSAPAEALATLDPYLKSKVIEGRAGKPGTAESLTLESTGESSAETVAILIGALRDRDEFVRNCAVSALGKQKDERAFIPLSKLLPDKDEDIRKSAVQAMSLVMIGAPEGGYGKQAVVPLIDVLKDKDKDVRKTAAELLGGMKDDRAVDPLIEALKDADGEVRKAAAAALGKIKDKRAVEPLINVLKDEDRYVRRQAAFAFWETPDERSVKPLIDALSDEDTVVISNASIALARAGDERAVEPLMKTLKNKDPYVRRNAATALGLLKDKQAVKPLISALKDKDGDVRKAAASALGKTKDNRAVKPLIDALKDKEIYVRRNAAAALGMLKDKQAVKPLISTLKDTDKEVRKAVALALGRIEDSRAVGPLTDTSKMDEDEGVRNNAAAALARIKKPS